MRRRVLFRITITVALCLAILLFCLVNIQVSNYERADYRRIVIRGSQDLQLLIINKKDIDEISQTIYEQDHLAFDSEVELQRNFNEVQENVPEERFESRQLSVNSASSEEEEFYYDNSIPDAEPRLGRTRFTKANLTPVMSRDGILPRQPVVHLCVVVCEDRAKEALTMLKSVAMVTKNVSIMFHIIADESRQKIMQEQLEMWPQEYSYHISYHIYNVTYFEGTAWDAWTNLYKPCAVQRLFLPDRLVNVDSLIYVDTDTVFLHSILHLWRYFDHFNSTQLISLVKESEDGTAGWYNRFASHPFYGDFGVNSGVMLMNLTRLRRTNWLSEMQAIYKKYQLMITWGDQDLINIYFSKHPEQLFIMPCEWNYRTDHCMYVSNCKTAEEKGVSLLHGSRGSFYQNKEPAFKAIHEAFGNHSLGDSLKLQFLPKLQKRLKQALPSNCLNVQAMFLIHLSALASKEGTPEAKFYSGKVLGENILSNIVRKEGQSAAAPVRSPILGNIQLKEENSILNKLKPQQLGYLKSNFHSQNGSPAVAGYNSSLHLKSPLAILKSKIHFGAREVKRSQPASINQNNDPS